MKKIITRWIMIAISPFLFYSGLNAQDIHFSQFDIAKRTFNPAATGAFKEDYRFTSHYKDQWRSIGVPYKTIFASADLKTFPKRSSKNALGLGASFYSDKAGSSKMGVSIASLSMAYHIQLNKEHTLGSGFQCGFGQRSVSLTGLRWDNQFDGDTYDPGRNPIENLDANNFAFLDLSGGLFWNHVREDGFKANAGVSASHLNSPPQSFYENTTDRIFPKIVFHGEAEFVLENTNTAVIPAFMFTKQGPYKEINAGGMIKYILGTDSRYTGFRTSSSFYLGGFYRFGDAIAIITRLDLKNNLSMGISYDINISKLRAASSGRGGMEISLIYKGAFK